MAVRLSTRAYAYARELIADRRVELDEHEAWSRHQPSSREEIDFVAAHGWDAYGRWHLAVDDALPPRTKPYYKLPYGDFRDVHRCAILDAEARAGVPEDRELRIALSHLHSLLELQRHERSPAS
jgi:hypothetical protein